MAEQEAATAIGLHRFAEAHCKRTHNHRNQAHSLQLRLNSSRVARALLDDMAALCRTAQTLDEEAHAISMGLRAVLR